MSSLSGELLMGPVRLRTNAIGAVDERRIGCGVRELVGVAILFAIDHVVQLSPERCRGEEKRIKRKGAVVMEVIMKNFGRVERKQNMSATGQGCHTTSPELRFMCNRRLCRTP